MISSVEAEKLIKDILSEKRYYHSVCTANRAVEYAKDFGLNEEDAKVIGLLHDIAKEMSKDEKLKYVKEHGLEINEVERNHLGLLHGKIAAHKAKTKYGVRDELADAIEFHTTGRANMTIWDKILYIADVTGEDRHYDNTEYFYKLSKENFDEALKEMLIFAIKDRLEEKKMIHIESINALNYLLDENRL